MARIKRAYNPSSPKTPRVSFLGGRSTTAAGTDKWSGSKHDAAQLTRITRAKQRVRVLRAVTNSAVRDMTNVFTNNTNPKYDPSQHPGSVQIKKVQPVKPVSGDRNDDRGHMKVFHPNRQTLFGGKTLKRKQF